MYGWTEENDNDKMSDDTDPETDSSLEPPPEPRRRRPRIAPGRTRPTSEAHIRDEPVRAAGGHNVEILRVGARLRDIQDPAVNVSRPETRNPLIVQGRAAPTAPRTRHVQTTASDEILIGVAPRAQAERQFPVQPPAPSERVGQSLRDTRRRFISDGRGSGRSYYMMSNGSQISLEEDEADQFIQGLPLALSPPTSPRSTAGPIERRPAIDESHTQVVRRMEAAMTPWSLNTDGTGPTPTEIYQDAYRRLDGGTATGEERRVLQMLVQRGIDGVMREERQSGLDMWPRGV